MNLLVSEPSPEVFCEAQRRIWQYRPRPGPLTSACRNVPEETPVVFVYQGASYAVMMATPADLGDFALGFSLNEGIISAAEEIAAVETVATEHGIVLRIALVGRRADAFWERRRFLAGPSGCGLCGLESLAAAVHAPRCVAGGDLRVSGAAIHAAMAMLPERQTMNRLTGALHAAAFWTPGAGIVAVREDVGRHNALDKLTGAVTAAKLPVAGGAVLLTSRVSVEMVQKSASLGVPIVVAVSAPTALALRAAAAAGITLIAIARHDGFETFTHAHRVV